MAIETEADLAATTYADVAAADAAAETRRGATQAAWDALTDDADKLAALTAATRDLDTLDWIGDRASVEQALEWPRLDAETDAGTEYSEDSWPTRLVDATIELAFAYAPNYLADATADPLAPSLSAANIKREKVGPIETEYFTATTTTEDLAGLGRFPLIVQNLLRTLVRSADIGVWGTGTVSRGS